MALILSLHLRIWKYHFCTGLQNKIFLICYFKKLNLSHNSLIPCSFFFPFQTDVIVNSVYPCNSLRDVSVSKAILKAAGDEIEWELQQKITKTIIKTIWPDKNIMIFFLTLIKILEQFRNNVKGACSFSTMLFKAHLHYFSTILTA